MEPVMETYSYVERGVWQQGGVVDTAGGPLTLKNGVSNPMWCQNPQYAFFIPPDRKQRTTVKLVVKRIGPKKKNAPRLGVCACLPTIDLPDTRRRRTKKPGKEELLKDAPLKPLAASTLTKTQQAGVGAEGGVVDVDRKLQVQRDEWALCSYVTEEEKRGQRDNRRFYLRSDLTESTLDGRNVDRQKRAWNVRCLEMFISLPPLTRLCAPS